MNNETYLVDSAEFNFDGRGRSAVSFLGENADESKSHITLIVGANGTSKSRILASLVEKICEIQSNQTDEKSTRRSQFGGPQGLECTGISISANAIPQKYAQKEDGSRIIATPFQLPSRVLVLSNLVMDKFHFFRGEQPEESFYHYLGVRQSSNLMTTGSTERAVTESVLHMVSDANRLNTFQNWVDLVFGSGRELAFAFYRLRSADISKLLEANDRSQYVSDLISRRSGSARMRSIQPWELIEITRQVVDLFEFLAAKLPSFNSWNTATLREKGVLMRMSELSQADRNRLTELIPNFSAASRIGVSAWPTLCIESSPWLPFGQLSSGEQNILSVGAKLAAYSRPGSLIAIDEPEVSLNVAWQQQYIDLVERSLTSSPGCHVLIATHSPHLISSVPRGRASIVLVKKEDGVLSFKTNDANFEGWGAESVLYQLLGIPSASSFHLNRDLAEVLIHIQNNGRDKKLISKFLNTFSRIEYEGIEPIELVIDEVKAYLEALN
jgi:hypothetical protein